MKQLLGFFLSVILLSPWLVHSAEVLKVKGKSALVDLKGDSAMPGDTFYTLSADGKRRGIIRLSKVKGEKAIGKITKGRVEAGMSLELKASNTAGGGESGGDMKSSASDSGGPSKMYWGFLVGMAQDKMTAKVNDVNNNPITTTSMSGMGFSAKGLFDYEFFKSIWFRGSAGFEGFDVSGNNVCGTGNAQACNATIYYLSFDFMGRYVFDVGNIKPWGGIGVSLLFPASKKATALATNSITTTNAITPAVGVDWHLSNRWYIPVSLEYGLLPKSSEVEASWIAVRAGLAFPF